MKTLNEYQTILSQALRLCAKTSSFACEPPLAEVFRDHRRLIVAINHATPLSWLPASALLVANACARGGGSRTPIGVMDRFFFQVPFFREIASLVTQTDRALTFSEIVERFEANEDLDLVVFPEGSNCFFGSCDELQDFRSPKFIEIAIRTGAPILVVAHRGSENWACSVEVPPIVLESLEYLPSFARKFLETRLREKGQLVVPLWPMPMAKFEMICELYRPQLAAADLKLDPRERREQLEAEARQVHLCMQKMLRRLKGEADENPIPPSRLERLPEEQLELFPSL